MGRCRQPLPAVPLFKLSKQQRIIYSLAANHSTREISQILSIPEKQVRQVYSAIRSKSKEFANKNVPSAKGAEPARDDPTPGATTSCCFDFIKGLAEYNGQVNFTESELFIIEHINKGISIREISALTGKSVQSIRKTYQRAKKKLRHKDGFYDDNCITKVDTGNTYVKINHDLIHTALQRVNLSREQIARETGILPERMEEIEKHGILSYDELFLLIRHLKLNPYGPSEKDELLKKLSDTHWIRMIRTGVPDGSRTSFEGLRKKISRDKSRYLNRVIYYGTAHYRYNGFDLDRPIIEAGRNGLFPVKLTRDQLAECGWLLKRLMIKPVYTYRYRGFDEDDSSIFIINKNQLLAINKFLFGS